MECIYLTENHLVVETEEIVGTSGLDLFTLIQNMVGEFREKNFIDSSSTRIIFSEKFFKQLESAALEHYGKYEATQIYGVVYKVEESPKYPIQIRNDF